MPGKIDWYNLIFVLIGAGGGGTLIMLALLKWRRFRKLDAALVAEKKAQIGKIQAETDISIFAEYRVLVQQLRDQLMNLKKYCDELEFDLEKEKANCEVLEEKLAAALHDIRVLKAKIEDCERRMNKQ